LRELAPCDHGGFPSLAWDFVTEKTIDGARIDGVGGKGINNLIGLKSIIYNF